MKKKAKNKKHFRWLIILAIVVLFTVTVICSSLSAKINISSVEKVTITMLPSPPKTKTIEQPSDLKKVIEQINNIKKFKVPMRKENGWEILINIYGEKQIAVSYMNCLLFIDNDCYIVLPNERSNMRSLYDELDGVESDTYE